MKRLTLKEVFGLEPDGRALVVKGWVRTKRETKAAVFLEINDGSRLANLQCVFDAPEPGSAAVEGLAAQLGEGRHRGLGGDRRQPCGLSGIGPEGRGQGSLPRGDRRGSARDVSSSRKGPTPSNSCAKSPICGLGPIPSGPWRACATAWPSRFISSSRNAASSTSILPS